MNTDENEKKHPDTEGAGNDHGDSTNGTEEKKGDQSENPDKKKDNNS